MIFIKFESKTLKREKRAILNHLDFDNEKEHILISHIIKEAINKNTILYALKDSSKTLKGILGLIALSASKIEFYKSQKPTITIDLLFVSKKFRKQQFQHFNNQKISEILLEFAVSQSYQTQKIIAVRYLILYPYNQEKKLISFYKKFGFLHLDKEWLYLKL